MKFRLFLISILLACNTAQAQDSGLVSLLGDDVPSSVKQQDKDKEEEGLFSFLNFKMPDVFSSKSNVPPIEQIIKMADEGNVDAQLMLGYSYLYGENGLSADPDKSFEYYSKAALQNSAIGLNNLGSLYYSGIGVKRNSAKASVLFAKSAELGNPDAALNLGFMLISGNGAPIDKAKALDYFEQASTTNPAAKFMTGYAYHTGILRTRNNIKAAPMIKAAADAGFDEAQLVLASIYINGLGFPQNYNNAVRYLKMAVSQGSVDAMMQLAQILSIGDKYNRDIEQAHTLYNLAAVRGSQLASQKRQELESRMKINDILQAQVAAENYVEKQSELTKYIRQTYGANVRGFFN